jgi:hypothetical protein
LRAPNELAAVDEADFIVVTTPSDEYKAIPAERFGAGGRRRLIVDCWRCLDADAVRKHADVIHLGYGAEEADPGDGRVVKLGAAE